MDNLEKGCLVMITGTKHVENQHLIGLTGTLTDLRRFEVLVDTGYSDKNVRGNRERSVLCKAKVR